MQAIFNNQQSRPAEKDFCHHMAEATVSFSGRCDRKNLGKAESCSADV